MSVDEQVAENALIWRPRFTVSDATQRRLWENLRDLRDVSEETSLINLPGDVSEICKSALFEMSLRRCMRRLNDAFEMHPCRLGCVTLAYLKPWHTQNPSHIQNAVKYLSWNMPFKSLYNLAYSQSYIHNSGIFWNQRIFRTLPNIWDEAFY